MLSVRGWKLPWLPTIGGLGRGGRVHIRYLSFFWTATFPKNIVDTIAPVRPRFPSPEPLLKLHGQNRMAFNLPYCLSTLCPAFLMDLWGLVKEWKFRQPSSGQERRLIGNVISHRPSPSSRPLPGGTVWGCVKARARRWKDWLPLCAEDRGLLANSATQCGMWLG